ncbi:DUF748 domain-containing protein [Sandaracinobacteroides hominis]|uniref:DUF748 domain-containing protein n=1 Tax=Sandaracinobacteroides hominis TaxID=2780086 RepID=UPI0018F76B5F|nr:DUF748 domain-containing protein [Sandaracinobacteroides hominis]
MNEVATVETDMPERATASAARRFSLPSTRILLLIAGVLALLLALYAAAGYLWAPRLIEDQARAWTRENLKQDLAIGDVKVDPFGFKVDMSGIAIPAAEPMVSVRRLHLDFAIGSIFSDSYRFDEVLFEGPQVKAIVQPDGKLNLLKLVPPPNPDPFPPVLIADLRITDGAAYLADLSKANKPDTRLTLSSFDLQNLHTTRDEGGNLRLEGVSDEKEEFVWIGKVSMAPIASSGGLAIRNLQASSVQKFAGDLMPVVLNSGRIDLDLSYLASYGDKGTHLSATLPKLGLTALNVGGRPELYHADTDFGRVDIKGIRFTAAIPPGGEMATTAAVGGIAVRDIKMVGTGPAKGEAATLKSADVEGINVVPATSALSIGAIRLAGLDVATTRAPDGTIGLMRILPPAREARKGVASAGYPAIGEFSLTDAKLKLADHAVKPASTWTIAPLTVTARGQDGKLDGPLKLSVNGKLNGATAFSATGDVSPATPSADLAVKMAGFPLKAGVPYTIDFPALEIVSGTASADGRLRYSPKAMGYTGNASIDNLQLIETFGRSDLVAWKRLALAGIDATPKRVLVERASLSGPATTVVILPDGTMNFQRLVTMNPEPVVVPQAGVEAAKPKLTRAQRREIASREEAEKQATAAKARAALAAPVVEPAIPVTVKRLSIDGGTLDFADYSLRPNFAAKVQGVGGTVTNVSNSPRAVARLDLGGFVIDKFSPVTIKGEMTPMQYDRRTQVDMAFRNIELPVFNPYSGRWAGYSIAKGKLTTELSYTIDNRALDAKHHIIIDQLEWGEATDSKEKVGLPVKFITSLMKDKNGVIDLEVPVTGTLDDPSFKIGPIIWKIIGNLFAKALAAPFKLFGGDKEDVQFIDFAPGSAAIPPGVAPNFATISKGLGEKPELRLDIPSGPGLPLDAQGLADQKIAAAAMPKTVKKGETPDMSTMDLATRHDRLKDLYKARYKKGPEFPAGPEGEDKEARRSREVEWLMVELRKSFAPTAEELAALGKARAEAVRLALLEGENKVDPARVFLSGRDSATEKDGKARMELKLEGS